MQEAPIKSIKIRSKRTCIWQKCKNCGWTGRHNNTRRPETKTSFNTPDIQKRWFYVPHWSVIVLTDHSPWSWSEMSSSLTNTLVTYYCLFFLHLYFTATQLRCSSEIFNNCFIANCLQSMPVRKFLRDSVLISITRNKELWTFELKINSLLPGERSRQFVFFPTLFCFLFSS